VMIFFPGKSNEIGFSTNGPNKNHHLSEII